MREYLLANGWQTLWNEDYWIKKEWIDDPSKNIDTCGYDTKSAYYKCLREELYKRHSKSYEKLAKN